MNAIHVKISAKPIVVSPKSKVINHHITTINYSDFAGVAGVTGVTGFAGFAGFATESVL